MKRHLLLLLCLCSVLFYSSWISAQVPQGFNYQAVVRDTLGQAMANQTINIKLSLHQGAASSPASFVETHTVQTDAAGLFSLVVGEGVASVGSLAALDWTQGTWFLTTELSSVGSNSLSISTTQQLLAVPYAHYATVADSVRGGGAVLESIMTQRFRHYDSLILCQQRLIDSLSFRLSILAPFTPEGATYATFSVAANRTVRFSKGNLQFNAAQGSHATADGGTAQGTWRFAEHQWDTIGFNNRNIRSTYNGWIDLFGWGTSGWNSGAVAYQPWEYSYVYGQYTPGGNYTNSLVGAYANADWGVFNAISNGGNRPRMWRTLTQAEWKYLFENRRCSTLDSIPNARYAKASVEGVHGVMLFPDHYIHPEGVSLPVAINATGDEGWHTNAYTSNDWLRLEAAGCVFLPAAGTRPSLGVINVGTYGFYWSTTYGDEERAYYLYFYDGHLNLRYSNYRSYGRSVRLVQD